MRTLYIAGEIDQLTVEKFLLEFNKIPASEPLTIYVNSIGGEVSHGQVLMHLIDANYTRITLIACGEICSCAFEIFFFTKCEKILAKDTVGMCHFMFASVQLNENGVAIDDTNRFVLETMKTGKPATLERYKNLGLDKRELGKMRSNKDVYFTYERLKILLDGQNPKNESLIAAE